jgi:ketosteroid isomerase-like protein
VSETQEFLAAVLPRLLETDTALHNGDAALRKALWSTTEPLTLFGAAMMTTGWPQIEATFDWLATQFSDCTAFDIEVVAAGASGDLAYLVAFEHTIASIGGNSPAPYALRVTTIFRREAGSWKVVHRHADHLPGGGSASDRLSALNNSDSVAPATPSASRRLASPPCLSLSRPSNRARSD